MIIIAASRGRLKQWVALGMLGLLLVLAAGTFYHTVISASRSKKLLPIYSVGTDAKRIAISFDACWGAQDTAQILAILDKYKVKTTFFLVNIWLEDYPQQARAIAAAGHEIGLHSTSHPHFTSLAVGQMQKELDDNLKMIKEITGYNAKLFRPPFGDYNDTVIATVQNMGLTPIQWDVDSLDWREGMTADRIKERVLKGVKPGSIVLFHNNGAYTAEAVIEIIPELQARGYTIVPVSQLLLPGAYYVDVNGVQRTAPQEPQAN